MRKTRHFESSGSFLVIPSDGDGGRLASSWAIVAALLAYLVFVKVLLSTAPQVFRSPSQAAVFEWKFLILWAAGALIGVVLCARTGFPSAWPRANGWRSRVITPSVLGIAFGILAVTTDALTGWSKLAAQEMRLPSIHINWPESLLIYPGGAIIVEVVYRLATIPLLVWIISNGVLRGRAQTAVFWSLTVVTSAIEPLGNLGLAKYGTLVMLPVLVQDYALNLSQAWIFRRNGFLASIITRVSFYMIWHVAWGLTGH